MLLPALVVALVLHHAGPSWKHVTVTQRDGALSATLAYDRRALPAFPALRRVRLTVTLNGTVVIARPLSRLDCCTLQLTLRDVWGDAAPEALVEDAFCGNRCSYTLFVGVPETHKVLRHEFGVEFGNPPWAVTRHDGRHELATRDGRFFCNFSDCASSITPVQFLAISAAGDRFVDVSRSHPALLRSDAAMLWGVYRQERQVKGNNGLGALVPWCADQYRLGVAARCNRLLPHAVRATLARWGYR